MNHLAQQKKKQETVHSNMKKNQKITKIKHHEHAEREENGYKTVQIANY